MQSALGHAAGVSRSTVSNIERGLYEPSVSVALRLAAVLGCTVEELFQLPAGWVEQIQAQLLAEHGTKERRYYSVAVAAQLLGIRPTQVLCMIDRGKLPMLPRMGGEILIAAAAVDRLVAQQAEPQIGDPETAGSSSSSGQSSAARSTATGLPK